MSNGEDTNSAVGTTAAQPPPEPPGVYLVEFKGSRKEYYHDPYHLPITQGDPVIVQVERGEDIGRVIYCFDQQRARAMTTKPLPILRIATDEELAAKDENRGRERQAKVDTEVLIARRGLPMKLVDVEWQFDGNKIMFYFTADRRVDFRELVKELAGIYRSRIELRQIGARDEARRIGGIGICGLEQCCNTFLRDFEPVTTQLARDQSLSLNPAKISGNCGRLLCCLRYEVGFYRETSKAFPKLGSEWDSEHGRAMVQRISILRGEMTVRGEDGEERRVNLTEIRRVRRQRGEWFRR